MGVERAVTRWYLQRQLLLNEIAQLEQQIAQEQEGYSPGIQLVTVEETETQIVVMADEQPWDVLLLSQLHVSINQVVAASREKTLSEADSKLLQQLQDAQAKLKALGHCPKPMMG